MLSSSDCFITPYYKIPVDKQVNDELWKTGDCTYISRLDDEKQMGVEIQLPFITYVMEEYKEQFTIVPIYVGFVEFENLRRFAKKLIPYYQDSKNLFIFSVSLTHWDFDKGAIEALKKLNFKAFDYYRLLNKMAIPEFPVWAIFLWLVSQVLMEDEYRVRLLTDEEYEKAFQETAELIVHGQSWSLPSVTPERSCISFLSASLKRDRKKCQEPPPEEPNPLNKCC
ncbi:unnamed protein product [Dibothriocephalus latus]|uniref:Uncharacterized protein n=1 Tax=Dibothriocephalus latus TaxID=60516 RepID=A0A3P7LYW9_DIBLA|nr:unnamed protein product [Dibothriocephalus latus]